MSAQKVGGFKLSVVILSFNEEENIRECIASVLGWADEIFIVDSFSTDRTVDIALAFKKRRVLVVQHRFRNYSDQWNWALKNLPIAGSWTLKLDADERVTAAFIREANEFFLSDPEGVDGVYFRRSMIFMGKRLRWGGTRNNYDLRLWRTGRAVFEDRAVNEHALVKGRTTRFKSLVDHYNENSKGLSDWLDKHNRYSSMEAASMLSGNVTGDVEPDLLGRPDQRRMALRLFFFKVPFRHLLFFVFRYFFNLGFLDGKAGFQYAFLHVSYFYWIDLKLDESKRLHKSPIVVGPPRGGAHPKLRGKKLRRKGSSAMDSSVND